MPSAPAVEMLSKLDGSRVVMTCRMALRAAAWELGVGSVPATVYDLDLASRLLGLPDDRRCDFLLSFGYPADPARLSAPNRAGGRVTLEEIVREERW